MWGGGGGGVRLKKKNFWHHFFRDFPSSDLSMFSLFERIMVSFLKENLKGVRLFFVDFWHHFFFRDFRNVCERCPPQLGAPKRGLCIRSTHFLHPCKTNFFAKDFVLPNVG